MEQARPGCRAPLASGHSLYGRVATLDGRVATLYGRVATLDGRVATLSTGELPLALTDALRLSLAADTCLGFSPQTPRCSRIVCVALFERLATLFFLRSSLGI